MIIVRVGTLREALEGRIRATLSVLMRTGVDWEHAERNPVAGVKLPSGKP